MIIISLFVLTLFDIFAIAHRIPIHTIDKDYKLPHITLLKPIKNIDDGFVENIKSFYELDYPKFDIIFGVDSKEEECAAIVKKISKEYNIKTKIIETGKDKKGNPKIATLMKLLPHAKGKLIWMTDSNVRAKRDTLKTMVIEAKKHNASLVFSPIRGSGSKSTGSFMENMYLNLFVSGSMILAWKVFNQQIIVGKSMLFDKATLIELGGFERFLPYLAEDFIIGEVYQQEGKKLLCSMAWISNINTTTTIKQFVSRMSRWAKIRISLRPITYILEILLNPIFLLIPYTAINGYNKLIIPVVFIKILLESIGFFSIGKHKINAKNIISIPFLVIAKDMILAFVYFLPFFSRRVNWRGRKIKIGKNTKIIK